MLITKTVKLRWNSKIKKHYVDLGYTFTKMKDSFEVRVEDLTKGSFAEVECLCDYCGKRYTKKWYRYLIENKDSYIQKDCCNNCKKYKIQEVSQSKYGVNSVLRLEEVKEKVAKTNKEKYGVENPFASKAIQKKIVASNIKKYGTEHAIQSEEVKSKVSATCRERYGVDYYVQKLTFYGEDNPRWKGGITNHGHERATNEYISWRKSVFGRDKYTCQKCGSKNKKGNNKSVHLNAHHIYNWKDYPDKRYEIGNGITLCSKCHNEFHSIYGKKFNNKNQIDEFLNIQGKKLC